MAFDPTLPADGSLIASAELRSQFTGLYDIIPKSAMVYSVATVPPGSNAAANVSLDSSGTLYFTFDIPQGQPGEVSLAQLNDATNYVLGASSSNSNAVVELTLTPIDPDMAVVVAKVNELILALRR